ncbi:MAG: GH1 family beta-glucosidase [Planctomycetota bacterium]
MHQFPADFLWGVASAAYQVEGAFDSGGRGPSVWDALCRVPGAIENADTGEQACDQYGRYEQDAKLIAGAGAKAYRFSLSWPRILPEGTGRVNASGLAYYDKLVDALLANGVQPWATLYHWDFPLDLFHRGGWLNPDSPKWFADYTSLVVDRLSDRVQHWMTLNEPQVFLCHGHIDGIHAPGMKYSRPDALLATHHALMAHGRSVQAIRARARSTPTVGWAPVGETRIPATESKADIDAARKSMFSVEDRPGWMFNNTWFSDPVVFGHYPDDGLRVFGRDVPRFTENDLDIIKQPLDFYGVNIYQAPTISAESAPHHVKRKTGFPHTMFRWPVTPEALYWGPKLLHERYKLPVYITENGLASMDWVHTDGKVHDQGRIDFLTRYLRCLRRAVADGADVRGYFHWSIMDNFEWAEGYRMRFGLVYVDYETLERIPKDSYHWYKKLAESNGASLPEQPAKLR